MDGVCCDRIFSLTRQERAVFQLSCDGAQIQISVKMISTILLILNIYTPEYKPIDARLRLEPLHLKGD